MILSNVLSLTTYDTYLHSNIRLKTYDTHLHTNIPVLKRITLIYAVNTPVLKHMTLIYTVNIPVLKRVTLIYTVNIPVLKRVTLIYTDIPLSYKWYIYYITYTHLKNGTCIIACHIMACAV